MAEDPLAEYRQKRNFSVTNEPKGKVGRTSKSLRFSVQRHAARKEHYDLRLEYGGVAVSWAIPKGPSFNTSDKRLAVRVEDHPVDYMDFEGVIPKGEYGGGVVMLWDEGEWIPRGDPAKGLEEGSLKFRLNGVRLKGDWALVRMKAEDGKEPWLLIKEKDGFAKKSAGLSKFTRGVRSGKTMAEIRKKSAVNPFSRADVMLATLCEGLPADMGWVYELKYDGHRTLGYVEGGRAKLSTRNGHDCTAAFSAAAAGLEKALGDRAAVVDGEMVVAGEDGVPDFSALQAYAKGRRKDGLVYVLFDLLALDGEDLRTRPLTERKEKLRELLKGAPPVLAYSEHTGTMTQREQDALRKRGMEGIVIKRADSPYTAGKNGDWLKLKFLNRREFVVGGYLQGEDGTLRSLLVGYFEKKSLRFAGCVGTGFKRADRAELAEALAILPHSPFIDVPEKYAANAVWVKPALAVEVEFAEMTPSGLLRQASFKGTRTDKPPREITDEGARNEATMPAKEPRKTTLGVAITHPEKVMFPDCGLTKLGLAEYYFAAASRMLPYVKDRLLSIVCCPAGIEKERFFRKHLDGTFAGIRFTGEGEDAFFYATGGKGILSLVQYNAVEFHIRGSKKGSDRADVMVFDLDPDEGLPLTEVRRGARDLRAVLAELGLEGFLKTSGGKGYHVAVPFRTAADPQAFRDFSEQVVGILEAAFPDRYTSSVSKKARAGKIFIDWQRNGPGATSVAPYSVRARGGAPVSMPISWKELGRVAPNAIDVRAALRRLQRADPWEEFFAVKAVQRLHFKTSPPTP